MATEYNTARPRSSSLTRAAQQAHHSSWLTWSAQQANHSSWLTWAAQQLNHSSWLTRAAQQAHHLRWLTWAAQQAHHSSWLTRAAQQARHSRWLTKAAQQARHSSWLTRAAQQAHHHRGTQTKGEGGLGWVFCNICMWDERVSAVAAEAVTAGEPCKGNGGMVEWWRTRKFGLYSLIREVLTSPHFHQMPFLF